MVILDQMKVEIQNLRGTLEEVTASLDLDNKKKIIEELSREMEEPNFWDNAEKANKKTKDLKNMQDLVANIENLGNQYNDIIDLIDMQNAEGVDDDDAQEHQVVPAPYRRHAEPQQQEEQSGQERVGIEGSEEIEHRLIMPQVHLCTCEPQRSESQQQQSQTEEEVADVTVTLHVNKDNAQEEAYIRHNADVERHTCRHDPGRQRRSDVGTHDDRDGLCQRQQAGVDKRNRHHRRSC